MLAEHAGDGGEIGLAGFARIGRRRQHLGADASRLEACPSVPEQKRRPGWVVAGPELERLREAARGKPTNETAAAETALRVKAQAFNAKVAALNGRVAYAQDARDRFSKTCKGRKYYYEDIEVVRNELPPEIAAIFPAK